MSGPIVPESNFKKVFYGTAAERAAYDTSKLGIGNRWETESGDVDEWTGTQWVKTHSGGAAKSELSSGSVLSYGNYPSSLYFEGSSSGSAAGTLYASGVVTNYNRFTLEVATLGATSVDVYASIDGTNFVAVRLIDNSTGAVFGATAINATGMYHLDGKFKAIRVDLVGTGASSIRFNHGNV
jgi:hypothetical protein